MGHGRYYVDGAQLVAELRFKVRHLAKHLEQLFGNRLRCAGATSGKHYQAREVTVQTIEAIGASPFVLRCRDDRTPLRSKLAQITIHELTEVRAGPRQGITRQVNCLTGLPSPKQGTGEFNAIIEIERESLAGCAAEERPPSPHASMKFFVVNRFPKAPTHDVAGGSRRG